MLKQYGENIWALRTPLPMGGMDITTQMVIIRLPDQSLALISPVAIDGETKKEIDDLGEVRHIISPNNFHHMFAGDVKSLYPSANYWCSEELKNRVKGLPDSNNLHELPLDFWQGQMETVRVSSKHLADEIAFYHKESKTLILTDLLQKMSGELSFMSKLFALINGVRDRAAVSRLYKLMVKDKNEFRESLSEILKWDFETALLAHNCNLEDGAKTEVESAFSPFFK